MKPDILCIFNQKSGPTEGPTPTELDQWFSDMGNVVAIVTLQPDTDIDAEVAKANSNGIDIVVAAGGDGTVSAVASSLVRHGSACLGILPLGTLNHLAKDLNIPLAPAEAVKVVCQGSSDAIDVAQVNGVHFLNNSSLGLYPVMVKLREKLQRRGHWKWWAAAKASIRALRRFRRLHVEIKLKNGDTLRRRTSLVFVGNNSYVTSGAKLGTRPSLKDGALSVMVSTSQTRWGLVKTFGAMMLGKDTLADIIQFEAAALTVSSSKKLLAVATDGEIRKLAPPLRYTIHPKALEVLTPPDLSA